MLKRGLDQMGAWILAILVAGILFGSGYGITAVVAKKLTEVPASAGQESGEKAGEKNAGAANKESEAELPAVAAGESSDTLDSDSTAAGDAAKEPAQEKAESSSHTSGGKAGHSGSAEVSRGPHWDYKGSAGPEHWAELSEGYKTCGTGKHQSPIDIDNPTTNQKLLPLKFNYHDSDMVLSNNGHTVNGEVPSGNYVEIDGERYDLYAFNFHAPSEHKILSAPYDFEMQLFHKNPAGQLAVISVLFEEGTANKALLPLWKILPSPGEKAPEPVAMDLTTLLPPRHLYYQYTGSLTTPPCTEGVHWFVLTQPLSIAAKQVDHFVHLVPFNSRPVQPANGRKVAKSAR